jgi:hypothetical protein
MKKWLNIKFLVGLSFCLHAIAGILMIKFSEGTQFPYLFQIAASCSLIPIVLLAENLKKMVKYLLIAVSAVPIFVTGLLLLVLVLSIAREGLGSVTLDSAKSLIMVPVMIGFLFFVIIWPYLLGALFLRIVSRAYLNRRKG